MIKLILADVFKNVNTSFGPYEISLILTTGNKTCTQMAFENNTSHDKLTRMLYSEPLFEENIKILMEVIKKNIKNVSFIIDDTFIPKEYSQKIEGVWLLKDGSGGNFKQGLSIVVISVKINDIIFPLGFLPWIPKQLSEEKHETKIQLAIRLINKFINQARKFIFLIDGLYSSNEMIEYCDQHNLKYDARIASNRIIEYDGKKTSITKCAGLKKIKNERSRTIKCIRNGLTVYITAQYFINKKNKPDVKYIISNYVAKPSEHCQSYKNRWKIEEFFRATKQLLGLNDCQAHSLKKQLNHVLYVMNAYFLLQINAIKSGYLCMYKYLKNLRLKKNLTFC